MKILFVSDTYYPHLNGVYYFVCRLAPLLKERGHEVAVIAPSETMGSTLKIIDRIDVYGIPSLPVLYYPKVRFTIPVLQNKKIRHIIEAFHPDVVHVQDHFPLGKAAINISNAMGIPVVATNHFMTENLTAFIGSDKWKKRISRLLWKKFSKAYNRVALVTTPSEWAAGLIRPKLKTRVQTVSSGIDIDSFTPAGSGDWVREKFDIPDKPVLLFVGRLDPEKKIEETIRAVAVALSRIDFCFVIVGKGIKKTFLEKQVKELGIQDHVIFTGFVTDIELPYLYRLSNCFIISSTAELLSLGALQGMAAGLPVIAVNAGALSELIQPGENGFLYSSGDISALAGQICDILGNKLLAKKMSEKSSAAALKHEISSTVLSFEKIYLELAEPAVQSHKISIKPLKYKMA